MKRRIGEIPPDCKHGMYLDWCSFCSGGDSIQTYKVHPDYQCYVPDCQRRAKYRIGPVLLCLPHTTELETVYVRNIDSWVRPSWERPDRGEEFVYFVRIDQAIKIGHSTNVRRRVKFYGAYGQDVEVLAVEWGDRALEKKLHRRFDEHRAPVGTSRELFNPHQDILDYIESERTCAFCKTKAIPLRAVCGKHQSNELYGEEIIGWATGHSTDSESKKPQVAWDT